EPSDNKARDDAGDNAGAGGSARGDRDADAERQGHQKHDDRGQRIVPEIGKPVEKSKGLEIHGRSSSLRRTVPDYGVSPKRMREMGGAGKGLTYGPQCRTAERWCSRSGSVGSGPVW